MSQQQKKSTRSTVETKEAAYLLNISAIRLRQLLQQGRVVGAYKEGRCWKIPLYKGIPKIKDGSRGPEGTWSKKRQTARTQIHINETISAFNEQHDTNLAPISVKIGAKTHFCHEVNIPANASLVYRPDDPLPSGEVLWMEVDPNQVITMKKHKKLEVDLTV